MLCIGAVSGTGIFVLTAEAAQKAGPGMMVSFVIAGFVCAFAALCYAEMASMVPVSGSAYTYSYAVMGEMIAWMVGWALILEYRSEEHTSELQSLMRISYAVFCLKKKKQHKNDTKKRRQKKK